MNQQLIIRNYASCSLHLLDKETCINIKCFLDIPHLGFFLYVFYWGHSPEMSSTLKKPKISIRTLFFAIYLHQRVQYVVCACSSYLALSEYVTYNWIALIFLSLLRS